MRESSLAFGSAGALLAALLIGCTTTPPANCVNSSNAGTAANPFLIQAEAHLIAGPTSSPSGFFVVCNNINLTSPWTPLPTFSGSLDGNGMIITGLDVATAIPVTGAGDCSGGADKAGLFSALLDARVSNLFIQGTVNAPDAASGLLAGCAAGSATRVDHVVVVGDVAGSSGAACTGLAGCAHGGMLGLLYAGTLFQAFADADTEGTDNVGGLVGLAYDGTITQATAHGAVRGSSHTGGLVGANYGCGGVIEDSYATGRVSSSGIPRQWSTTRHGGLVGVNDACGARVDASYSIGGLFPCFPRITYAFAGSPDTLNLHSQETDYVWVPSNDESNSVHLGEDVDVAMDPWTLQPTAAVPAWIDFDGDAHLDATEPAFADMDLSQAVSPGDVILSAPWFGGIVGDCAAQLGIPVGQPLLAGLRFCLWDQDGNGAADPDEVWYLDNSCQAGVRVGAIRLGHFGMLDLGHHVTAADMDRLTPPTAVFEPGYTLWYHNVDTLAQWNVADNNPRGPDLLYLSGSGGIVVPGNLRLSRSDGLSREQFSGFNDVQIMDNLDLLDTAQIGALASYASFPPALWQGNNPWRAEAVASPRLAWE